MSMAIPLVVGAEFLDFEDVEQSIIKYEQENFVKLYRRSSRRFEAAVKRAPHKAVNNERLKYYQIDYWCIHGGKCISKSTGKRPSQTTFRKGCPAKIKLSASKDGQKLIVTTMIEEHNHEKLLFRRLPHQRRFTNKEKQETLALMEEKANMKLVKEYVNQRSEKRSSLGNKKPSDIEALAIELQSIPGVAVEFAMNGDKSLQGIFYQEDRMKKILHNYPEVLFFDIVYKLNNLKMNVYIMITEDGNGEPEIVGVFAGLEESLEVTDMMIHFFKENNPHWTKIQVILADINLRIKEALKTQIAQAEIQLSTYHVLRSFSQEMRKKQEITRDRYNEIMHFMEYLTKAQSEEDFSKYYAKFIKSAPECIIKYFNETWYEIRHEWVYGLKQKCRAFGSLSCSLFENVHQNLKQVIDTKPISLFYFFSILRSVIANLQNEKDHRATIVLSKISHHPYQSDSPEAKYIQYLTPYAFQLVFEQLEMRSVDKVIEDLEDHSCVVESPNGRLTVGSTSCGCCFWKDLELPCHHIFAVRSHKKKDLYVPELIAVRWTLQYYKASRECYGDNSTSNSLTRVGSVSGEIHELPQEEKYIHGFLLAQRLAYLASEVPMKEYLCRLAALQKIAACWEKGTIVNVEEINNLAAK